GGEPVCFDNIVLAVVETDDDGGDDEDPVEPPLLGGVNLVRNGDFSNGTAGWGAYGHTGDVVEGQYCGTVNGPVAQVYDAGLTYDGLELPAGDYVLSFDVSTTRALKAVLQENGGAYHPYASADVPPTDFETYEIEFTVDALE